VQSFKTASMRKRLARRHRKGSPATSVHLDQGAYRSAPELQKGRTRNGPQTSAISGPFNVGSTLPWCSIFSPGVSSAWSMREVMSTQIWILLVLPPRDVPIACVHALLLSFGRSDASSHGWNLRTIYLEEDSLLNPTLRPTVNSVVDRRRRSINVWNITPAAANFQEV
jgi:hypothetical protein